MVAANVNPRLLYGGMVPADALPEDFAGASAAGAAARARFE
jgi:hypothetical protein